MSGGRVEGWDTSWDIIGRVMLKARIANEILEKSDERNDEGVLAQISSTDKQTCHPDNLGCTP